MISKKVKLKTNKCIPYSRECTCFVEVIADGAGDDLFWERIL